MSSRRWYAALAVVTAGGLGLRIATVYGNPNRAPGGDAYAYHNGANLLAAGHGFINPVLYLAPDHFVQQSASYPPLFMMLLSLASFVGFKSFFAHRIWTCILGATAIPLAAFAGKEISGRRVGIMAAAVVAIYPNIWMNDELVMSEALSPVLALLVLFCAYRFWRRPEIWRAVALGAAIGLAAMARDEMALLALLVLPLTLLAHLGWRRRAALVGLAAAGFVVIVGPWVGYNMARFAKPTFISTGFGITLASANCDQTYNGQSAGYWSFRCALDTPGASPRMDQSVVSSVAQKNALSYVRHHLGELPRVEFEREGRAFGFYRPWQQVQLDSFIETRPQHWAEVGLASYYLLVLLSIPGVVALRRRRVPVYPLLALGLDVVISVAVTFGQTRYRGIFEAALALMAAVGVDAIVRWARGEHRETDREDGAEPVEVPDPAPLGAEDHVLVGSAAGGD